MRSWLPSRASAEASVPRVRRGAWQTLQHIWSTRLAQRAVSPVGAFLAQAPASTPGRDPAWASWVGGLIVRAVAAWQRRVARARSLAAPRTGAIQAEAATTWRSPATADLVRGSDRLRAWCDGFSLHAGVVVPDYDRAGLERLCRSGARPAFAHDRLAWTADGRISYRLKRPWPDGRTHLVLEPVAFMR